MQNFKMPKKTVKESTIEEYLRLQCKKRGWLCEKFTSPSKRSVPDRLVTVPGGVMVFVELKAPGKKPTKLQAEDHKKRRALGCTVEVIDTKEAVDKFIKDTYTELMIQGYC